MARSLTERMLGAAVLDTSVYEEVEHDASATGQAAAVVILVAVCQAIGSFGAGPLRLAGVALNQLLGWLVWAGITYAIGTWLFKGTATWGELLRTLGFAQTPGVLVILAIVPLLGWMVLPIVAIWMLITGVVAIRQALDVSTGKAVFTALLGWLIIWVVRAVLF